MDTRQSRFMVSDTTELESNAGASIRREVLIDIVLSVGGLAAVFAGTEIFNALVTWLHWR
jgi:hypothetical protein